jgi:heme A synthase
MKNNSNLLWKTIEVFMCILVCIFILMGFGGLIYTVYFSDGVKHFIIAVVITLVLLIISYIIARHISKKDL